MALPLAAGAGVVLGGRALGMALRRKRDIAGKVVMLTGASRGLGAMMAVELAKEGVKLCLVARSPKLLEAVAAQCREAGAAAVLTCAGDVADPKVCAYVVKKCKVSLGAVEILVNNAAVECTAKMQDMKTEDIAQMNAVNVTAPMVLTRLVLPDMLAAKYGVMCTISSGLGGMYAPYLGAYAATKWAVNAFTASLRAELQGTGVSCFALMPGIITKINDGGMAAKMTSDELVNLEFSLNPMDFFFRSTAQSMIKKVIKHVKMGAPQPIVGGMRMPVWAATFGSTLFPATVPNLLFKFGMPPSFKKSLFDKMEERKGSS